MATTSRTSANARRTKLEIRAPATGELLGTLPVHSAEDVNAAVQRGRRAFEVWAALSFAERRTHQLDLRREMVRRMDAFVDTIHAENGKPRADAATELMLAVTHLTHAANRAEGVLKPRRVSS